MTSHKFDLATELLKGGLPLMAQAIAKKILDDLFDDEDAEAWFEALSAATPPANVEQPSPATEVIEDKGSINEPREVEGATGANAELALETLREMAYRYAAERDANNPGVYTRACAEITSCLAKLSTSEARVRGLEAQHGLDRELLSHAEKSLALLAAEQSAHEVTKRELSDTRAQLLAERTIAGLKSKLNSVTIPIDPLRDAVVEAARVNLAKLENYFEEYGAEHLEDCPEDSTCECPLVVELNASLRVLQEALSALDASSKPDAPLGLVKDCPDCSEVDYCKRHIGAMMAAPIAEPEPAERPTCEWRSEEGGELQCGDECGRPATSVSCIPLAHSFTCDEHKCRCAKPYPVPSEPSK